MQPDSGLLRYNKRGRAGRGAENEIIWADVVVVVGQSNQVKVEELVYQDQGKVGVLSGLMYYTNDQAGFCTTKYRQVKSGKKVE